MHRNTVFVPEIRDKTPFLEGSERIKDTAIVGCPSSRHSSGISYTEDDILNSRLIETACVKSTRLSHVEGGYKDPVEHEAHRLHKPLRSPIVSTE